MRTYLCLIPLVVGCGGSSNKPPDTGPDIDAKVFLDAPVQVPAMITVSGVATKRGLGASTTLAGVTVGAYRTGNDATPEVTATTDAQGKYTLLITTNGVPLDGYLKATNTGLLDTYLYPPSPLVADFTMAQVNMVDQSTFDTLSNVTGAAQLPANGFIAVQLYDSQMMPVGGATVESSPASGAYRYDDKVGMNVIPTGSATATYTDGIAYMFNVPPTGTVQVSATKTGITFHPHSLPARAGAFTTTLIGP